ncbi:hypothetical protein PS15p_211446 [Mucor circinelloides]
MVLDSVASAQLGFYIGEKHLKMFAYPQDQNALFRRLSAVLRTILAARKLMENIASMLTSDATEISIGRCEEEHMIPSFMSIDSNKRRKRKE